MRRDAIAVSLLVLLLTLIDQLYRVLHPVVDLERATLVGATAWAALLGLRRAGLRRVPPARGALAIAASAFGSVLLIEAGWLVSRSALSAAVHVLLLALAYRALRGPLRPAASAERSTG